MKKVVKETPLTKFYFPLIIKMSFIDFCKMSGLPYGRVLWTLARMFTEGRIDKDLFVREYYKSSQSVLKNQTENLINSRISGDKAHEMHKELTTEGGCAKLEIVENPNAQQEA